MSEPIMTIKGIPVFKKSYEPAEKSVGGLVAEGMIYRFSRWLNWHDISDDNVNDVWNNTSEIRDGNRLDIHDNYILAPGFEITYLYCKNDMCWAMVYNKISGSWLGEIEIESR